MGVGKGVLCHFMWEAAAQICFGINVGKLTGLWFARGRRGKAYFLVTARNRKYNFSSKI